MPWSPRIRDVADPLPGPLVAALRRPSVRSRCRSRTPGSTCSDTGLAPHRRGGRRCRVTTLALTAQLVFDWSLSCAWPADTTWDLVASRSSASCNSVSATSSSRLSRAVWFGPRERAGAWIGVCPCRRVAVAPHLRTAVPRARRCSSPSRAGLVAAIFIRPIHTKARGWGSSSLAVLWRSVSARPGSGGGPA